MQSNEASDSGLSQGSTSSPASEDHSSVFSRSRPISYHESPDVAVVGMACRVAGDNNSPAELWESLLSKKDASGVMPDTRWEPYYRRDSRNPKILANLNRRGYFIKGIENFDAAFFGISPKEAVQMDPQQRISLEVAWEALEDAGIAPQSLAGSNTGVFMGVNSDDYSKLLLEDLPGIEAWMGIGTAYCGVPNRISYILDLNGPSTAVDGACASSLVAIHHGRQALMSGESDVALVGGVNALCGPGLTRILDIAGVTSKEGRCCSFDETANGYGRGEGASVIVLKRVDDAMRDNDRIHAILKGSSVAHNGKTNGIMAPDADAQQLVARTALSAAGISPSTVQYVEAHATSTSVGDPVEVEALAKIYGPNRAIDRPCLIGSIKPNVGHLEAGAGAMGFMKAVLAVRKGIVPPQANLTTPNSKIDWQKAGVHVPTEATPWPDARVRRAGISSYGYGGSVSHAVIENAPRTVSRALDAGQPANTILVLSSPQAKRIPIAARNLARYLTDDKSDVPLAEVAATLAKRRNHFDYRAVVIAEGKDQAVASLQDVSESKSNPTVVSGRSLGKDVPDRAVWVFSGHGAQWPGMGQDLLQNDESFRSAIQKPAEIIEKELDFSPIAALAKGDFSASDQVQALTFLMQIGLTASLHARGVMPGAIVGHSVGEIAAAVASGALTVSEGAMVVARRARLYRQVMGHGAMMMVGKSFADVKQETATSTDLCAAISSSPTSTVVSGSVAAVEHYEIELRTQGLKPMRVKTDIAFHSPILQRLAGQLSEVLANDLHPKVPSIPLYTTASVDSTSSPLRGVEYWITNMVSPVFLTNAISAAVKDGWRRFMEVSTHPILTHSINETVMDMEVDDCVVLPTLRRNKSAFECLDTSLATLWCSGASIDWSCAVPCESWAEDVPRTEWFHQPYWKEIQTGASRDTGIHDVDEHVLLGQRTTVEGESLTVFTTRLDSDLKPFPGAHPLHGTEIVPAAVLFHTFVKGSDASSLSNVTLRVPVAISAPRNVQIVFTRNNAAIKSRLIGEQKDGQDDASWLTHTTATLDKNVTNSIYGLPDTIDLEAIKGRLTERLKDSHTIDYLADVGVSEMGFPWKVVEHYGNLKEMLAKVDTCPGAANVDSFPWSRGSWASILDSATSIGSTLFFDKPKLRMPAHVENFTMKTDAQPPKVGYVHVQEASSGTDLASDITVLNEEGQVLAKFTSMRFSEIEGTVGVSGSVESLVHQIKWRPATLSETGKSFSDYVLVGNSSDDIMKSYSVQLASASGKEPRLCSPEQFLSSTLSSTESAAVIYVPSTAATVADIAPLANTSSAELLLVTKHVINSNAPSTVYAITSSALSGATSSALAQSALVGLSRIISSEHPEQFGGLIDVDSDLFPIQALKYVQGCDIIRIEDTVPKVARLRPFPREKRSNAGKGNALIPTSDGTYLISGGLGVLGLEVAEYLVQQGARRLLLLSRRALPPRRTWGTEQGPPADIVKRIAAIEAQGASVFCLQVDITAQDATQTLLDKLDDLALPPVQGVVHAAGVLEDQMVMETTPDAFNRVTAPKITGGLTLHEAFPPGTLRFFALFSSCGQLFGFPGQASYAAGNAFLDSLAAHRRAQGDATLAFQWTSWRGLGMAASTDFIEAELENRGITSISVDEGFRAWEYAGSLDTSHAVVLRSLAFDADEPVPAAIAEDIAIRRVADPSPREDVSGGVTSDAVPKSGPELAAYLDAKIRDCVSTVLSLQGADEVDPKVALSELGMDSVMTVTLRRQLQAALKVKVPPTLVWSHPTVGHLVKWFAEKIAK